MIQLANVVILCVKYYLANISSFVRLVQFTGINSYYITKILRNDIFMTKLYATNISTIFVINILLKMGGGVLIVRK